MSLFKNKLIRLSLIALLFNQVSIQASEIVPSETTIEKVTFVEHVKHGFNLVGHYGVRVLAGAGAALGVYLVWNNANEEIFLRTTEVAQVATAGAVAGLGLGYITRGQVEDLRQAYKNKNNLDVVTTELNRLKPRLAEAEKAELSVHQTQQALITLQTSSQLAAEQAKQQTAILEQARLQATQHAQKAQQEVSQIKLGLAYLGDGVAQTGSALLQAAIFQIKVSLQTVSRDSELAIEGATTQQTLIDTLAAVTKIKSIKESTTNHITELTQGE